MLRTAVMVQVEEVPVHVETVPRTTAMEVDYSVAGSNYFSYLDILGQPCGFVYAYVIQ